MKKLSSANEQLRRELSERERDISALQLTVSSLESRPVHSSLQVSHGVGTLLDLHQQDLDPAAETVHHITRRLIADCDELQAVAGSLDQVNNWQITLCTKLKPIIILFFYRSTDNQFAQEFETRVFLTILSIENKF